MIKARKDNNRIVVHFKRSDYIQRRLSTIRGAICHKSYWTIPAHAKQEFEDKLGGCLIIWAGEDVPFNGGLDEADFPTQPVMDGYSVTYDGDRIVAAEGFKQPPYGAYQVVGFNALMERDKLILADEQGLGKTFQVLTAIEAKKKKGLLQRCLILAKASLLYNWRDEIEKFTDLRPVVVTGTLIQKCNLLGSLKTRDNWDCIIMSYETYRGYCSNIHGIDDSKPIDAFVLDEAQKIRNPWSKIGQFVHFLTFKYIYILTATPLPNTPLEAYNYLNLMGKLPEQVVDSSYYLQYTNFNERYAIYGGYHNRELVGYKNMNELRSIIQDNMLRRLKKQKLKELPDVVFRDIKLELPAPQRKIYDAIRKEILADLVETNLNKIPSMLAKLMRLQQITSAPENLDVKSTANNNVKLSTLMDLLEEITDAEEKAIIFCKFRPTIALIEDKLAKFKPAVIHGDTPSGALPPDLAEAKARKKYKDWNMRSDKEQILKDLTTSERQKQVYMFQEDPDCKVFIGSITACGEGLNLTAASNVIYIDFPFHYMDYSQSWSRAHRIGQKNAVTVYNLICSGTIDEKIFRIIMDKKGMSEALLDTKIDGDTSKQKRVMEIIRNLI